ncbi:DISULFIDE OXIDOREDUCTASE [Salix viminalis]|uniref:DISULFIDE OXIDOREDUCTASE n=1 Tax=Salix viminalis TaxID=40686 RepID=A0A9Q0TZW7_SALVM|nr:DISULFIDE OXIDOREDUCTASE [Salix viminalis]
MFHEAQHSFASHGVKFSSVEVDLPAMMAQKDKAVSTLTRGIGGLFKKNKVNYVKGYGKFISPSEVSVDTIDDGNTVVKGKNIIIATGSDFKSLPGSLPLMKRKLYLLLVLRLCNRFQRNLWSLGQAILDMRWAQRGPGLKMKFMLKTKVVGVDTSGDGVKLTVEAVSGGDQTTLEADVVLVSAGRTPFSAGLGLDKIGQETDKAHKAEEDGVACVEFIAGKHAHVDYDKVPGVVYTHPEVASVGKTEEQVKALGVEYCVGKFPFLANSRAKAIDDAEGLVKIIAEKETDKILGVHIMAPNAGELIHGAVLLALAYDAASEDIARVCHARPTMSEALKEAAMATHDKPIHI